MVLPPFPSQDLAKLVLGYLAEEQLMTAYDEFLQASPYLDALRNEYDRIFMTSLKNILAEYRAVKIYLETCTPLLLRKKLLQCINLLEIVKILIQIADINKLDALEPNVDQLSFTKNTHIVTSSNATTKSPQSAKEIEVSIIGSSVETTPLEDLPGRSAKNKSIKVHDQEYRNNETLSPDHTLNSEADQTSTSSHTNTANLTTINDKSSSTIHQPLNSHYTDGLVNKTESIRKIEEFNNILDFVYKNGSTDQNKNPSVVTNQYQNVTTAGTFRDFTTGIHSNEKIVVPDCLKTETNKAQAHFRRNNYNTYVNIGTINATDLKSHLMLTVDCAQNSKEHPRPTITSSLRTNNVHPQVVSHKREENKIKILSDVKVDKSYENLPGRSKMPPVLSNATPTPFHLQTILINGTPAYKNKIQCAPNYNFTKDEIMAMPTIILVPATETTTSKNSESETIISLPKNDNAETVTISSTQNVLKPLSIDVTSNTGDPDLNKDPAIIQNNKEINLGGHSLVKTVETTGHVSLPKDNKLSASEKTSTPQGFPPKRKSSSTPRRNSHIRVLDFTTPRRILHESINEQNKDDDMENKEDGEVVQTVAKDTVIEVNNMIKAENISSIANVDRITLNTVAVKENKTVLAKKSNWDADLRAVAVNLNNIEDSCKPLKKSRHKTKIIKKKNIDETDVNKREHEKIKKKSKKVLSKENTDKNKLSSKNEKNDEEDDIYKNDQKIPLMVKPNINIITSNDWGLGHENDKNQNKGNISNDQTDTPESERITLQNAIGAKLNISDFLETPYKQALYDIQMETPKFLGPDLPDEPISDVKIMNIPTPRFLCSPKGPLATPSTYSSRPTDYSSGGSYYKPDDQDYVISTEVLESPITTEEEVHNIPNDEKLQDNANLPKLHRPVRQCRKNVSYFKNISTNSKTKESPENDDLNDTANVFSRLNKKPENQENCKSKEAVMKSKRKSENIKKASSIKKSKTPLKRETPKTFMKIKPRKTTPIKEIIGRKGRKLSDSSQNKQQKRTSSKDKNVNLTPTAASIPTKSRRKSSTPRKLPCTKSYNSESSSYKSPELSKLKKDIPLESQVSSHESDVEQLPLRWSDEGSQDGKTRDKFKTELTLVNDSDDISKIKEYIETTVPEKSDCTKDSETSLHSDLIKRGFDIETARIIERDLLDSPCSKLDRNVEVESFKYTDFKGRDPESIKNNSEILDDKDDDNEEIELSVHECNEDTVNYIYHKYDETRPAFRGQHAKLRDHFSMEICIDDDVTIRLRATTFSVLHEQDPQQVDLRYSRKETEIAVSSIANIDKLYTPIKDPKTQVYEIFDSTLTSLDTPLKVNSPKPSECVSLVTDVALEVEQVEFKEKTEIKKRKRLQSGCSVEELTNYNKKTKSETQYLLNTANIQNIDIESVLSKLHGP